MLPLHGKDKQRQGQRRKPATCTSACASWSLVAVFATLAGVGFWCLQDAHQELASLKMTAGAAEEKAVNLTRELGAERQRTTEATVKVESLRKEKENVDALLKESESFLALAKKESQRLREIQEDSSTTVHSLNKKLAVAEQQVIAAESERKEATRKAGLCEQRYASLNADCATLKQGLAKLGVTQESVQAAQGASEEGGLDPRGGMEAAKVLKDNNQLPWQSPPRKGSTVAEDDWDETGPGLEKPSELR